MGRFLPCTRLLSNWKMIINDFAPSLCQCARLKWRFRSNNVTSIRLVCWPRPGGWCLIKLATFTNHNEQLATTSQVSPDWLRMKFLYGPRDAVFFCCFFLLLPKVNPLHENKIYLLNRFVFTWYHWFAELTGYLARSNRSNRSNAQKTCRNLSMEMRHAVSFNCFSFCLLSVCQSN